MSEDEGLLERRISRIKDAIELREPDFVPFFFPTESWLAHYHGGYNVQEMAYNYDNYKECVEKFVSEVPVDAFWTGGVWPGQVYDATGATIYDIPGRDLEPDSAYQFPQTRVAMEPDEYSEFIEDPYAFIVEKVLARRHKDLKESPRREIAMAKGMLAFQDWLKKDQAMVDEMMEKCSVPPLQVGTAQPPLEIIEDHFRTMKGICLDIKRHPEEVKAACEALLPLTVKWVEAQRPPMDGFPTVFAPLHIGPYLSRKDFEEVYWPTFKKMTERLVSKGYSIYFFAEHKWDPYFDFIEELPKGSTLWVFEENTNLEKAKEVLEDTACVGGGLPTDLLAHGSKDELISHAEKTIEKFGPSGFILGVGRALLSPSDAKPENVRALAKFIQEEYREVD